MHTWIQDAPTGVYKNHALSSRMREAAIEKSVFMDHVSPEEGFGKNKGESITITRIANIAEPTSPVLSETERIPEDTFTLSTTSITALEIGRSVPYTSLSRDLSAYDIDNPIQKKLLQQLQLSLDTMIADAFKSCQVKYTPTGLTSNNIATNGTFGATATVNMNLYHVEEIYDYMYDTLHTPTVDGDYIGIFRHASIRGIMRDPEWIEWHKYTNPTAKFNGEVGKLENIRFIDTNHADALSEVGTGSVLGEGVVFGDDAIVMAEVMAPELLADENKGGDFGRQKAVAWYGILNFGEPFPTGNPGEARIVHVGSL